MVLERDSYRNLEIKSIKKIYMLMKVLLRVPAIAIMVTTVRACAP